MNNGRNLHSKCGAIDGRKCNGLISVRTDHHGHNAVGVREPQRSAPQRVAHPNSAAQELDPPSAA